MMQARAKSESRKRGYTLLEVMIALVMFGLISVALSMAFTVALRANADSGRRQDDAAEVRAVFGALSRDLAAAFGSLNNPASVFLAGGGGRGSGSGLNRMTSGDGLLTFTTLTHRLEAVEPGMEDEGTQTPESEGGQPQSDCALVRYAFDPVTRSLSRVESPIPNLDMLSEAMPEARSVLSNRVQDIQLRFLDSESGSWRSDWEFRQEDQAQQDQGQPGGQPNPNAGPNPGGGNPAPGNNPGSRQQPPNQPGAGSGNAGNAPGGGANPDASGQGGNTNAATGDARLPGAVEVQLTLLRTDGAPQTYRLVIPIMASEPQEQQAGSPPSSNAGGAFGQPGNGNNAPGGNPPGGGQPNGPNQPGAGGGAGGPGGARPGLGGRPTLGNRPGLGGRPTLGNRPGLGGNP